jgi:hypothetical protein
MAEGRLVDVRFVESPLPDDEVVTEPIEIVNWHNLLNHELKKVEAAIAEGTRKDLPLCIEWRDELKAQVWTPTRCVLVKRPVR